jgi:hypothetical protein
LAVHTSLSTAIDAELAKTPEAIDFLETKFGPYPFEALGGIVINDPEWGSRWRTRPDRSIRPLLLTRPGRLLGDRHELAHPVVRRQRVRARMERDLGSTRAFATYAEWLWQEHRGTSTAQKIFDQQYSNAPSDVWQTPPWAPGKERLFSRSVYLRGRDDSAPRCE